MNKKIILLYLSVFIAIFVLNIALSNNIVDNMIVAAAQNYDEIAEIGRQITIDLNDICFKMRLAPAAVFPRWSNDKGRGAVEHNFWVGETPVTYELWYEVRIWAEEAGYRFANPGIEGSNLGARISGAWMEFENTGSAPTARKKEPATMMNWRDAIIWSNALSEMLGYEPVYRYKGKVIREAGEQLDSYQLEEVDEAEQVNTDGFRLLTQEEWELAARYQGPAGSEQAIYMDGLYWTPGKFASGAAKPARLPEGKEATGAVAWYENNSDTDGRKLRTQEVGLKKPNTLGLYDMSGNVREWTFTPNDSYQRLHGGHWHGSINYLRVGRVYSTRPWAFNSNSGLRLARTNF